MKRYIFASFLLHVMVFAFLAFSDIKTEVAKKPPIIKITVLKQKITEQPCVENPKNKPDMPKKEIQKAPQPPKKELPVIVAQNQPLAPQKSLQIPLQDEAKETKAEPKSEIKTEMPEIKPNEESKRSTEVKHVLVEKSVEKPKPQVNHVDIQKIKNSYLEKITKILNEKKEYPKNALKLSQEGIVKIKFRVLQNGEITNHSIAQSSSYKLLDNASLKLLSDTAKLEPFPKEMQESHIDITIPIEYKLHN